jgi:signal transduction histidine kinase
MGRERTARLPWILAGLILAIVLVGLIFLVMGLGTPQPATAFAFRGYGLPLSIVFAAAGVLVASRVPANPIGWLLLAAGAGTAIQEFAQQYAIYGLLDSPGDVPGAAVAAWIPEWIWIPFMAVIALFIPLVYPDGHLPSSRWVWVAVLGGLGATIGTIAFALTPGPLEGFLGQRNPFGVEGAPWIRTVGDDAMLLLVVALLGTVASLVVRVRRSRGDERQQLKWLALAIAVIGVSFLIGVPYWTLSGSGTSLDFLENLVVLGLAGVPVAIGISILKYRLYDIDVVINKAVVYGILAAFGTLVYVAIVVGVGALVGSGGNAVLSAVAAAVIAIAFQPVRRRAQRLANRVVYGDRATPYEVLSGFSGRLAETYSIEDVLPRLARVLADGVGATRVAISLGTGAHAQTVASYPDAADAVGDDRLFDVRHQGELLGRIAVAMPPNESLVPGQEKLVADVAAQAGLVLRNAALIEDLRASRQRLVAAQDQERRRIERNIHDGAQQQLVALSVKLKLADTLVGSDDARAHAMLADLRAETQQALEDLRDLARGIYPPLLADKGLGAALESQTRRSVVPVSVETNGVGRYPQEMEAAVYFSCLEALQNVSKYAEASSATIRLAQSNGLLTFEVHDDGRGFDPAAVSHGSGLQGIADRLAALGGAIEIRSTPGAGTTIAGTLPTTPAEGSR